jgi:hypothetical protein
MSVCRKRAALFAVWLLLIAALACERKPRARERERLAKTTAAMTTPPPAYTPKPIPPEAPFEPSSIPNSGIPCEVDAAFAAKCRRCHNVPTRHGAPFVFLTWEETHAERHGQRLYELIGRAVKSGFMPYKIQANPPVEPLTEQEKQAILDWVAARAPRGDCETPPLKASGARKTPGVTAAASAKRRAGGAASAASAAPAAASAR